MKMKRNSRIAFASTLLALALTSYAAKNIESIKANLSSINFGIFSTLSKSDGNIDRSHIDALISNIEIDEGYEPYYDRDEYTSSTQHYEYGGMEYDSIREYAYYASEHYDKSMDQYVDPYTNESKPLRGMDYDHIIPLHYANMHGAYKWDGGRKRSYADNPTVGVNVNSADNRAKGDRGPSEWLPDENIDDYCYTWLKIADEWDISISREDMDTIKSILYDANPDGINLINGYR